jgi:hypothetical protein
LRPGIKCQSVLAVPFKGRRSNFAVGQMAFALRTRVGRKLLSAALLRTPRLPGLGRAAETRSSGAHASLFQLTSTWSTRRVMSSSTPGKMGLEGIVSKRLESRGTDRAARQTG